MGTVLLKCLVGGIAGILVWLVFEPGAPHDFYDPRWNVFEGQYVTALGCVIGAAIGGLSGWLQGGKIHSFRGIGLGLLLGAMGITFGHTFGGIIVNVAFGALGATNGPLPIRVLSRVISFTLMGASLGVAIGGSTLNTKRAVQGLIGGALAGAVGGMAFDLVGAITAPIIQQARGDTAGGTSEVGIVGRAFLALILGAVIGLFIGLVERLGRSAWLRLILGRNEGREWSIDQPLTTIGRDERATVPLFGDPNIAAFHAQIQKLGPGQYVLTDGGSPIGTVVNGQRVGQSPLFHGSRIQIGTHQLEFLMKNGTVGAMSPEMLRSQQAYPMGAAPTRVGATPYSPMMPSAPASAMPAAAPGSLYGSVSGSPAPTSMPSPAASMPTMAYGSSPMAPVSGGYILLALDGPIVGIRYPLVGAVTLGRESPNVPMSFDTQASRRHAEINLGPAGPQVTDLGSTNGTFVNGQRIQTTNVRPGDVVKVGSTSFRIENA